MSTTHLSSSRRANCCEFQVTEIISLMYASNRLLASQNFFTVPQTKLDVLLFKLAAHTISDCHLPACHPYAFRMTMLLCFRQIRNSSGCSFSLTGCARFNSYKVEQKDVRRRSLPGLLNVRTVNLLNQFSLI